MSGGGVIYLKATPEDRLRRKLERRDRRIAGLERRIAALESALARRVEDAERLPRDVTRAVQEALCNVRMIPVVGFKSDRIVVEVKKADA